MKTLLEELKEKNIENNPFYTETTIEYKTITDLSLDLHNDKQVYFDGCDFNGLKLVNEGDIQNIEFRGCIFNKCDFQEATFQNCSFIRCTWNGGSLKDASFKQCQDFRNSTLNGANLRGALFEEIPFMGSNRFCDCNLSRTGFVRCELDNSWFEMNQMMSCDFNQCNLSYSGFYKNINLVRCGFYGSCLNQVKGMALFDIQGHEAILDSYEMQVGCTRLSYEGWEEEKVFRDHTFNTKAEFYATIALVRANKRMIREWEKTVKRSKKEDTSIF